MHIFTTFFYELSGPGLGGSGGPQTPLHVATIIRQHWASPPRVQPVLRDHIESYGGAPIYKGLYEVICPCPLGTPGPGGNQTRLDRDGQLIPCNPLYIRRPSV